MHSIINQVMQMQKITILFIIATIAKIITFNLFKRHPLNVIIL